ncbi:stevor [Plasmodium falciparum IGH-CR14]|uniref:Stevor n=1 Tax=Plasmodium falciparum IGH-CR14 TaxID=580059 RepID=A0A0L1I4P3_PLAFA|nr:stevor [Plasmodium falciparum IGH-CR14]
MNIYYVKMLLFTLLINTLVLPHCENYINNHYNIGFIHNNTQRTIKSRLLAETKKKNSHYQNDPELKKIIDELNKEAIKKYQESHDPYEQLQELVEKNETKIRGGSDAEPMSTTEKELLETYEEMFGEKKHIMLKSSMYPNNDDKSSDNSSCECADYNSTDLAKTKGKDKYLKHLKHRCIGGICSCLVGSTILTMLGLAVAKKAAVAAVANFPLCTQTCVSSSWIFHIFDTGFLTTALKTAGGSCLTGITDVTGTVVPYTTSAIFGFSIAIYVLIAITVLLIILYIWLYRRRKNSLKHECKKHLCK